MPTNSSIRKEHSWQPHGPWITARKIAQCCALLAFLVLFAGAQAGWPGWLTNLPMRLDPLTALAHLLASRTLLSGSALALGSVLLTLLFGRAWCGWLCPLGTLLDLFSLARWRGKRPAPPEAWRSAKYGLLLLILAAALFGNLTLLALDPLTILLRTLSASLWPAFNQVILGLESSLFPIPFLQAPVSAFDAWVRPAVLPYEPAFYAAAVFLGAVFAGLVLLNLLAERFWCRYLCPLGGLLGLLSRAGLYRRQVGVECKGCTLCTISCPTGTIDPQRGYASDPAECTVCMACVEACPRGGTYFQPELKLAAGQAYDPGRRQALIAMGAAAVGVALFRSAGLVKREPPHLLRPPGAREENEDRIALSKCVRCAECMRACPTNGLQPALLEAGLAGFATPLLTPRLGYCDFSCNACGQVCPSGAIPALDLETKRQQVIGKASIDHSRCLAWASRTPCVVCEEMCPLSEKAIQLETAEVWGPDGLRVTIQLPHVLRERCIGCGICEYKCPLNGEAAIRVYVPEVQLSF